MKSKAKKVVTTAWAWEDRGSDLKVVTYQTPVFSKLLHFVLNTIPKLRIHCGIVHDVLFIEMFWEIPYWNLFNA
jgi:hypothetical protein